MTILDDRPQPRLDSTDRRLDPQQDVRLRNIAAQAAGWPDRAGNSTFQPDGEADRVDVQTWLERAGGQFADRLADHLAGTGRNAEAGLGPVRWVGPEGPAWLDALTCFLLAQPIAEGEPDQSFRRAGEFLIPCITIHPLTADAGAALVDTLVSRLVEATQAVDQSNLPGHRDGWLDTFQAAPGLAYVIGIVCGQWASITSEMFGRLDQDLDLLRRTLWCGTDPGPITEFRGDLGDRHDAGHSVAILTFAAGVSVVYKPKELNHVAAFQTCLEFLGSHLIDLPLKTRRVILRGAYGWEEHVQAQPCHDEGDFRLFYRRLGVLVRLVQLLDGRDMWADNMIAEGEHPMLIDLECLLHPRIRPLPDADLTTAGQQALQNSVAVGSLVMQAWSSPQDLPVLDVSCLSRAGDLRTAEDRPLLPLPPYRPFTAAGPADPWRYGDEVIAGYTAAHHVLADHADDLLGPAGPLNGFRGAWIRYLYRNTWDCYKLISAAVSPAALAGGVAREIRLAELLRRPLRISISRPDLVEMAHSEIDGLRRLDVPMFRSRTDSTFVHSADGQVIGEHFDGTAWDALTTRVHELEQFDLTSHLAMLESCLDAARAGTVRQFPDPQRVPGSALPRHRPIRSGVGKGAILAAATGIGDLLLETRQGSRAEWIGQVWQPITNLRTIQVLSPDLHSGTLGIAVYLAELAALTGDGRHAYASIQALHIGIKLIDEVPDHAVDQRVAGWFRTPGGFVGVGAALHAIARCSRALGDATLGRDVLPRLLVRATALTADDPRVRHDVPAGLAGLLLNLITLRQVSGGSDLLDLSIDAAVATLTRRFGSSSVPSGPASAAIPDGADSTVMALARAAQVRPDLRPNVIGLVAEHSPDLSTNGGRLAALEVARSGTGCWDCRAPFPMPEHEWGTLSSTDLIRTCGIARLHPDGARAAEQMLSEILARRAVSGRWLDDRYAADRVNLGAIDGITAVGMLLLQALSPSVEPLTVLR